LVLTETRVLVSATISSLPAPPVAIVSTLQTASYTISEATAAENLRADQDEVDIYNAPSLRQLQPLPQQKQVPQRSQPLPPQQQEQEQEQTFGDMDFSLSDVWSEGSGARTSLGKRPIAQVLTQLP
jgi:hypothetical protein